MVSFAWVHCIGFGLLRFTFANVSIVSVTVPVFCTDNEIPVGEDLLFGIATLLAGGVVVTDSDAAALVELVVSTLVAQVNRNAAQRTTSIDCGISGTTQKTMTSPSGSASEKRQADQGQTAVVQ